MKVMVVWKALGVGGYQLKLQEIAREPDIELIGVAPASWREPGGSGSFEPLHLDGYQMIVSPVRLNGHFHFFFFPQLGQLLDEHRPDILHVEEEPYNLATFLAVREARKRGIPSIFFTWQNLARRYPPPFSWIEKHVHRQSQWAIAGTESAASILRQKGYAGPISVIPQVGVDPETYHSTTRARSPEAPLSIGFGGRLVPEKGVAVLIEACARLTHDFRLTILGDGPTGPELRRLAEQRQIADRVEFRSVPSGQMPEQLQKLDVLVLPSLSRPNWTEQFGRILMYAMSCGVPVIGSTCGEIPSVIGDAGLIFPEGDVAGLTSHLERLADDTTLRRELGERGRERVLDRFTSQRVAEATVAVYRALAPASSPKTAGP
ncbi:MAG: glycosyltransferase family 1 protein [Chloroflexi bacterium]|nr:glycosyltransferase family 1 protein [Chloroflexota bacterium]